MARKTKERREELRERLIDIAEARVAENGIGALRARDLATEAGCALGAIYNVFDDMTGLVLAVNGRTFRRLGADVSAEVAKVVEDAPIERLVTMARAYLAFAAENPRLWRGLFEVEMSVEQDVPAWYMDELGRLFSIIAAPLAEMYPEKPATEIDLMTRALFSSVHGIVLLGLEKRISGVPLERIEEQIDFLLRSATRP
ncbi:TetR family transcriptional regulator [Alphaproteobacteria bacterium GH1-50]|uniref:TetR family transcriptional regulator n=1 Tax=Kangsaoukella pontilimi TaxID=2691042 RepID=A0A7C9ISZ3_9RHOB|nr:TetR/AcrR family transcriptional regulator [Kangsaoukella pontilimi]MXQ09126.1 TetR family transcriptional regulator [Kangsaoukella pontilimi]